MLFRSPEDAIGAQAASGQIGLEECIHRGKAVVEHVDDRDHDQGGVGGAELDQPGVDARLQQVFAVLVLVVLVHAAATVAGLLVADVERVVFVAEDQRQVAADEAAVAVLRSEELLSA